MEKVIYLLWRPSGLAAEAWVAQLRATLAEQLLAAGALAARLNACDAAVQAAQGLRQQHLAQQPDAVLQVWLDSANRDLRAASDAAITAHSGRHAAYLVTESQPLRNRLHPAERGERTTGFAQIALLRRPRHLEHGEWLRRWHDGHTPVAIETQSTFEYLQNVVVRALSDEAPPLDALVEECFPAAAMTDPQVFFDAAGDDAKFQRNLHRMMDSVGRFLDLKLIDVLPTSQYTLI